MRTKWIGLGFALFFAAIAGCGTKGGSSGSGAAPAESGSAKPAADPKALASAAVDAWVEAQNKGRLDDYLALYDAASFQGIRRSATGTEQKVSFEGWKKERARLFTLKPTVAVESRNITIWTDDHTLPDGVVRVGFIQRWKTDRYADHGPKVLRLRVVGGAARIIYEEMLASANGWADEPAKVTIVDGTTLVSPISMKLVGASSGGDQKLGTISLVLTDSKRTSRTIEIGSYNGVEAQSYPPEKGGASLFKARLWWAGAGDSIDVIRDGVGIIVKHQWEQETGDDPTAPQRSAWNDLVRVTLAEGAAIETVR